VHPILAQVELGGAILTFRAYGTFLVLAACVAGCVFVRRAGSMGLSPRHAAALFLAAAVAGLVGARVLDAVANLPAYAADPARLAAQEFRGFALYGGLAAAMAVALAWSRRTGQSLRRLADVTMPAFAAGIVLLRVGCFLNGCCEGVSTDLPWGVVFPPHAVGLGRDLLEGRIPLFGAVAEPHAVHPTQLYEIAAAVLLALAARRVARSGAAPGVPALVFATGFLLFRAANQALRVTPADSLLPAGVLVTLYLCAGLAAMVLLLRAVRVARPGAARTTPLRPATAG
jgi:phosphatidylglycerol:prolipoprotein diacylglycerol transferase